MPEPYILMLDEVDSTNTYARNHFDELPDGAIVAARSQTAGRGRRGRRWNAPPGSCILCTMVMKRLVDGFHAGALLGVGALNCLREAAPGINAFLKWPNDVYVEERKIAGILSESARIEQGRVTGVVSGIGINVNLPGSLLETIDQPATSLLFATKNEFNVEILLKKLAEILIRYYITYPKCAAGPRFEWKSENRLVGETISVTDPQGKSHTGIFRDILPDGGMVLEEAGSLRVFTCGDVKIDRASVDWERVRNKRKID